MNKKEITSPLGGMGHLEGARIGIIAKPSAEFVAGLLGTWLSGGVAVPLALNYPEAELYHVMNDSVCPASSIFSHFCIFFYIVGILEVSDQEQDATFLLLPSQCYIIFRLFFGMYLWDCNYLTEAPFLSSLLNDNISEFHAIIYKMSMTCIW